MSILDKTSIEAPPSRAGPAKADAIAAAETLLEKVGIADKRLLFPRSSSGGQQQPCSHCPHAGHAATRYSVLMNLPRHWTREMVQ